MRNLIIILFLAIFLSSCEKRKPDFNYKFTVAVVYMNGDKDTVTCSKNSFRGNEVECFIDYHGNLVVYGTMYGDSEIIVCGVRSCETISTEKTPIIKK